MKYASRLLIVPMPAAAFGAAAADYPSRPIRIVTTYPPGGSTDVVARLVAQPMSELQLFFTSMPSMLPHLKSGRLKALAIASATRSPAAPDIPTVAESGVPGYEYVTWYGLFAPAKTPRAIVTRLNDVLTRSLAKPDLEKNLRVQGSEPRPTTPEDLAKFMCVEHARWERVVKVTGLQPQ